MRSVELSSRAARLRLRFVKTLMQSNMTENPNEQYDSFIFLREATPMKNQCPSMNEEPRDIY